MEQSERSGILLALAGFAVLAFGDAVIKSMAGMWSPIAVAALRFTIGAAGLSTLLAMREGRAGFRPKNPLLQLGRGLCLCGATLTFFSAIFVMPLAEATSLVFLAPILTALLSGPVLGEKVRPATFVASAIAFVGVIVVLRPNLAEVGLAALLPLGAACCMALLMLANRASAGQGSPLSMQVYMALVAAPVLWLAALAGGTSGSPMFALGAPSIDVVLRCGIVAVTASTAHWLIFHGTTRAGAAIVAPMTYVQLIVAVSLGWWWFGDRPDGVTMLGATVIIGAGLYLWRDNTRKMEVTEAPT
ncbi:DMT family transporter [Erythrobacter sp. SDW2]|uniref:DMT family transporter n=1 Tax=Erythrobacter sp. SDW2 TaxID=2907154 RepID=UPI001F386AAB|nr:DMT family transporter [Erythrobacter sp. SDW2]UIP06368.1 DMT family transporter [Erythrobacter sp. SDW2]